MRYVLVECDDDAQADALCAQINAATMRGKKLRIAGLFARPKRFCQCVNSPSDYKKDQVVRGEKFGWWVCIVCKRPRLGNHQAKNMLTNPEMSMGPTLEGIDFLSKLPRRRPYLLRVMSLELMPMPAPKED